MVSNFETTIELLCSTNKLERDKGVVELEKLLTMENSFAENCVRKCLQRDLINVLMGVESNWERKHGCLLAARSLIACQNFNTNFDVEFSTQIKDLSIKYLSDGEARVRLAAGSVLGVLCQKMGPQVYQETRDQVLTSIQCNLERIAGDDDSSSRREIYETVQLMDKLMSGPNLKKRSFGEMSQSFYDSVGWQNLETSLKALQSMIEGCGNGFIVFINGELLSLIYKTLTHSNRFVRETGFYLISSLFQSLHTDMDGELNNPIVPFGRDVSVHLATGLADNWSQVRLAASVAVRHFLLSLPEQARRLFYPQLLPRMCLNRYYAADGVRMYSQETWRQVTGAAGRDLVQLYIEPTVEYYKFSTQSENSAVREAACACIAELATKMPAVSVRPLVFGLLETLLTCFQDPCWPVRDAACLACGNFVLSFPEESHPALGALCPMFYKNLTDVIPSVRQGAASSLANVIRAFGDSALLSIVSHLQSGLRGMANQEAGEKNSGSVSELTRCGKRARDNECAMDAAPSVRRKGSNDVEPTRLPQPWELADGCVNLLGEISSIKEAHTHVLASVPLVKEAARYKHYPQHVIFLESICKQLPTIAKNLGKRTFSGIVDEFFDDIFYALESENGMTSSAASQCLNQLATFLGQNILRAKVASYHPRYASALESVIFVAPF